MIRHLGIVGIGLIGGSLALALKKQGYVNKVTGYGRSEENLQKAQQLGIIDNFVTGFDEQLAELDVLVLAVPVGAMPSVMTSIHPWLSKDCLITDVGSSKVSVMHDAQQYLGSHVAKFVPGHPIAGSENSGVESGNADLFEQRKIILTPVAETSPDAIDGIEKMWLATGASVEQMEIQHHDAVLAATSHLPHMLAFALVSYLSKMNDQDEIFSYAAGGFRDFTRIASSDPVMWRDICLANAQPLKRLIHGFQNELGLIETAIHNNDANALFELFRDSKHTRDQLKKL